MTSSSSRSASDRAELLDLYKLTVEMADRVSARRGAANAFFVTVEAALASALTLYLPGGEPAPRYGASAVAVVGFVLSAVWWLQLRSYRDLNTAKFKVILQIEKQLVEQPFAVEWAQLSTDRVKGWRGRYAELGFSERFVPPLFALLYVVLAILGW